MKLQKNYKYGIPHKICGYQLHTLLEHKILRLTGFLETSVKLLSGNKALNCFKKNSSMFGNPTLDPFAFHINHDIDS